MRANEAKTRTSVSRLVVFSDDWGRHPSSCQRIMRTLATRYRIDWINTIGTRRPRLSASDFARGFEKLGQWRRRSPDLDADKAPVAGDHPAGIFVHAPMHWPGFRYAVERSINQWLLLRGLGGILHGAEPPTAVITTLPITAGLARATATLNWIYYCVDDLAAWPGLDAGPLRRMEAEQLASIRRVIATSAALCERMCALGHPAALLTHGVDLEHWRHVGPRRRQASERPVALFWGLADRRLDSEICLALANAMTLRIVGPRENVDLRVLEHPGIEWVGALPHARLPDEAARADVLVMPYADLPVTRAMQPLKLLEYLATAMPVVATPIPANRAWADAMDLADAPDDFVGAVVARASAGLPESQRRARERLAGESWESKANAFEQLCLSAA